MAQRFVLRGEEVKTKTENSRMRVCAIAREGEGQNQGRRKVRTRRAKVGKLGRKVVRSFSIVPRFEDAFAFTKSLEWIQIVRLEFML